MTSDRRERSADAPRGPVAPVRRILLHPREDGAAWSALIAAIDRAHARGVEVCVWGRLSREGHSPPLPVAVRSLEVDELASAEVDLVIALGGDGTLLRAGRLVADAGVPVLGVNLGDLGFLSAYRGDQVLDAIDAAADGRLHWEARERMAIEVWRAGACVARQHACNDAYIKHGVIPRLLRLATYVGGQFMAMYKADGLIVCTPTGSTAYNLAAGGPIVAPGTDAVTITPICPHSLTHRPVVVSASAEVRVVFAGPRDVSSAFVTADGEWTLELAVDDEIVLRRSERAMRMVPPHTSVFQVLATKMLWSDGKAG